MQPDAVTKTGNQPVATIRLQRHANNAGCLRFTQVREFAHLVTLLRGRGRNHERSVDRLDLYSDDSVKGNLNEVALGTIPYASQPELRVTHRISPWSKLAIQRDGQLLHGARRALIKVRMDFLQGESRLYRRSHETMNPDYLEYDLAPMLLHVRQRWDQALFQQPRRPPRYQYHPN